MITKENLERLSKNIYIIHAPTNIGILVTDNFLYIIDSGMEDDTIKQICTLLEETFLQKKIKAVLNTHSHADHSGGNYFLQQNYQAEVWTSKTEGYLNEIPDVQSAIVWGARPFKKLNTKFFHNEHKSTTTNFLSENNIITLTNQNKVPVLRIYPKSIPGHYFEQYGFLVEDIEDNKKVFFTGDALYGRQTLKDFWIPFMFNIEQFKDSIIKIEETKADIFAPSHGELYTKENIHEIAEMNKIVNLEIETIILKMLKQEHTAETLLKALADYAGIKLSLGNLVLVQCTVKSYLSSLELRGLISCSAKENKLIWKIKN